MKQTILFFTLALATWLPGCLSEQGIKNQLDRIETALRSDTSVVFEFDSRYKVEYDTTLIFQPLRFVTAPDFFVDGYLNTIIKNNDGLSMDVQYDTAAGVLRGVIYREPIHVHKSIEMRAYERFKPPQIPRQTLRSEAQ
jgi:hypothetical protein